ncbi:MAG: hypothetical protein J5736_01045, partial [Bacilli bacterium]|nr:hypothetical protein [Bacilli bacterium]
ETTDYQCLPFVSGVAQEEGLEAAFRAYIDETAYAKRDEFLSVYCNWGSYDNMTPGDPVFSSETLAKNFRDLDSFYEKSGSRPEYFLQDAFWFAEGSHYLAYDDSKLKEGPKFILDNIAKRQMKYGLWFDINFREDKRKDWTEMDNGLGVGALCLNEEKVYRAMEKAILARVKEDGIKMLKFDFAYFECHNPNHEDHSHDHVESKQKAILHFIQMVGDIRALDPEIKILCYNGWTKTLDSLATSKKPSQPIISPYWTRYVDRLYCGDPRPSEIPTPSFSDSVIYYTDSMVRNFYDSFIPLRCIDDHGSMCGNTGTIYYLGDAIFRKSILMNVARGGQKLNPYGDLGVLDQEDFDAYRKAVEMMKDMQKKNLQSVPILGDPRLEEVYGYFSSNGEEGYLTILNPSCGSRIADIDLPAWRNSDIELSPFYGTERSLSGYSAYRLLVPANSLQIYSWKRIGRSNQKYAENGVKSLLPERKMVLAPGQRAIIHAKSGALSCRFFLDEKPYRSGTGYPEGIRVLDEEEIPLSDSRPCSFIWSGLSWLWFPISEPKRVEIRNDGEKTYTIQIGQHPTI